MAKWNFVRTAGMGGAFRLVMTGAGGQAVDVTEVRGVLTTLDSYSSADPFGDATAVFTFSSITAFDDLAAADLGRWLGHFSDVDLYWVPAEYASADTELPPGVTGYPELINPLTQQQDLVLPSEDYIAGSPPTWLLHGAKAWEGFVTSIELIADQNGTHIQLQCQGALFQADRYLQKPFYPPAPQSLESLILGVFDKTQRPHLRTSVPQINWPEGWYMIADGLEFYTTPGIYAPNVTPGQKYTGYATRTTGSWDHALTGFIQDLIAVMITQEGTGVPTGNQWTLQHYREGDPTYPGGRTPVLEVRDRFRAPDFSIWLSTPGIVASLTSDATQVANAVYGDGTNIDGTAWRNAQISADGTTTTYAPLAALPEIYPLGNNPLFNPGAFASEAYVKYGTGFNQDDAVVSAQKTLRRDVDPGWSGTITLQVDPSPEQSMWTIRAGMTVNLMGLMGSGEQGINFHIAQVEAAPDAGTVTLTVDTRYRDLLNLEDALSRARDPLTPSKLLQLNKTSVMIEDVMAPWDYGTGSGYIPLASTTLWNYAPTDDGGFPHADWLSKHPPITYPSYYIPVQADALSPNDRWTQVAIPVLTSEKGTIDRVEIVCVNQYGNIVPVGFHCSFYYVNVTFDAMPQGPGSNGAHDAFLVDAFSKVSSSTGGPTQSSLWPDDSFIIGWGNATQKAGFSPGSQSDGDAPTGLLIDDGTWTYDNTNNSRFNVQLSLGVPQSDATATTIYVMFYAEYSSPLYFAGRIYKQNDGAA